MSILLIYENNIYIYFAVCMQCPYIREIITLIDYKIFNQIFMYLKYLLPIYKINYTYKYIVQI